MGTRQEASGGSVPGRVQRHAGRAWFRCDRSGRGRIAPRRFAANMLIAAMLIAGGHTCLSRAQEPAANANPADQPGEAQPLSLRYHFSERYSTQEDAQKPDVLTQYRVASRDTVTQVTERPEGAPDRQERSVQSIYTERVAKVEKGNLVDVVRRYDLVNFRATFPIPPVKTKRLEGLTVFYHLQNRSAPLILGMTPVRGLREDEFKRVIQESYLPVLSTSLPARPVRVGDTWPVTRLAAWALVGEIPEDEDYDLNANLIEVRKNPADSSYTAVIGIKGRITILTVPNGVNAQVEFLFKQPPTAPSPAAVTRGEEAAKEQPPGEENAKLGTKSGLIEARGHISKLRLAHEFTVALPGNDGRFKQTSTRRLYLERRTEQPGDPLSVPDTLPAETVENSWLSYEDAQGRFHFRHPQELRVNAIYQDGGVDLLDPRPDGRDVIQIDLVPKTNDLQRDRMAADPMQFKKSEEDQWKQKGVTLLPGPAGWLPDADWSPLKRKVYRFELALRSADSTGQGSPNERTYLDYYLVQFFRNEVLKVIAMTTRDPHLNFRSKAEDVIKSFEFGPLADSLPVASPPQGANVEPPR